MNPSFIPIILLWLIIFINSSNNKKRLRHMLRLRNQTKEEKETMLEAAKAYIGKDCIVYTFNSQQYVGRVKDVKGKALVIDIDGGEDLINTDFIVRLREHPVNKKGKKRSVVLD